MFTKKICASILMICTLAHVMPMQASFSSKLQQTAKSCYATLFSLFERCSKRTKIAVGVAAVGLAGCAVWFYKRCKRSGNDPKKDYKKLGTQGQPVSQVNNAFDPATQRAMHIAYLRSLPSFKKKNRDNSET